MYIIIVALFFNTATAMAMVGGDSQNGKGTLLCTLQGYQWVSLEGEDTPASPSFVHCQFCLFPASDDGLDYTLGNTPLLSTLENLQANVKVSEYFLLFISYAPSSYAQGRAPPIVTA